VKFPTHLHCFMFNVICNSWRKPRIIYLSSCVRRCGTCPPARPVSDNYRILFLGSDDFSIKSLDAVTNVFKPPAAKICVVVSNENNLLGKHVKKLNNTQEESSAMTLCLWDSFKAHVLQKPVGNSFEFDLGVVASFGHLIPSKVINQCQMYFIYFL